MPVQSGSTEIDPLTQDRYGRHPQTTPLVI